MKKGFLFAAILFLMLDAQAQNVGIGIVSPLEKLHVSGNTLINDALRIDGNNLNNGTLVSGAIRFGASNSGEGIGSKRTTSGNQWGLDFYTQSLLRMSITNAGNVGIGLTNPEQPLSVAGGMVIDQANLNTGTSANILRFGSNSGEGIGSKRTAGINQNGVDFFTNNTQRMTVTSNGLIGINTKTPKSRLTIYHTSSPISYGIPNDEHAIAIWDSSYSLGSAVLYMGIRNTINQAYITFNNQNYTGSGNTPKLFINPTGETTYIGGGWETGNLNQTHKLVVSTGSAKIEGQLIVEYNKGIIRSNNATQQKKLVADVIINTSFLSGETKTFAITWPETFGAAPDVSVGHVVSGAGGWAELVLTITNSSATGATLFVYNPKTITVNPNYTNRIIAIGAQ